MGIRVTCLCCSHGASAPSTPFDAGLRVGAPSVAACLGAWRQSGAHPHNAHVLTRALKTHVLTHAHTHAHAHSHGDTFAHVLTFAHIPIDIHVCLHMHILTHVHSHTFTHEITFSYIHKCTHRHKHTGICPHAHLRHTHSYTSHSVIAETQRE